MHECTSIIINSFHLFQQTKDFRVTHSGVGGAHPHPTIFFKKSPPSKLMPPIGYPPPILKMKPASHLKISPPH